MTDHEQHLFQRLNELERRYVDHFPKWSNMDFAAVGLLLSEVSTLRAELAALQARTCATCSYWQIELHKYTERHIRTSEATCPIIDEDNWIWTKPTFCCQFWEGHYNPPAIGTATTDGTVTR